MLSVEVREEIQGLTDARRQKRTWKDILRRIDPAMVACVSVTVGFVVLLIVLLALNEEEFSK